MSMIEKLLQNNGFAPKTPEKPIASGNDGASVNGTNQSEFHHGASESIDQEPLTGKEKDQNSKKRKGAVDFNKKSGEKRQLKYFRAYIAKPQTPKTPKAKTPKPRKKVVKKAGEGSVDQEDQEVVPGAKEVSSCKRALIFEDKNDIVVEDRKVKVAIKNQSFGELKQVNVRGKECTSGNEIIKLGSERQESLKVRPKRHACTCLSECRKIGHNFSNTYKKKRKMRKKKPIEKVKSLFDGFNYSSIIENGRGMALPKNVRIDQHSLDCILSLLNASMKFRRKKRSKKRLASAINVFKQTGKCSPPSSIVAKEMGTLEMTKHSPSCHVLDEHSPPVLESLIVENDGEVVSKHIQESIPRLDVDEFHLDSVQSDIGSEPSLQHVFPCSTSKKSLTSKIKASKVKMVRGPYKRKGKHKECFIKFEDWNGESVEQIMDTLVEYFGFALKNLYDDPKLHERWTIMTREDNTEGDGVQRPNEGDAAHREDKIEGNGAQKPTEGDGDLRWSIVVRKDTSEGDGAQKPTEGDGDLRWSTVVREDSSEGDGAQKPTEGDGDHRWGIMIKEDGGKGDGAQKPSKSNGAPKPTEEEIRSLEAKMDRFYTEMTKLQGPKDFVKWNGSVLDSVVGVFLTQNVSDVLSSNAFMELASRYPIKPQVIEDEGCGGDVDFLSNQGATETIPCNTMKGPIIEHPDEEETILTEEEKSPVKEYDAALKDMLASLPNFLVKGKIDEDAENFDWEFIRVQFLGKGTQRSPDAQDSVDWEAVRKAPVNDIAKAIKQRGQQRIIASKVQRMLNRLVDKHGTLDLEWLRDAPYEVAKAYLLSFYGLGLKSVECLLLLTLGHDGFPVDVNIGRIAVRLGWVPLAPLINGLPFHAIEKYPLENEIQQYLWPKLCNMEREKLYKIHYQMITFGKVFCMKKNPNCRACPFKNECNYYLSLVESIKTKHPLLPWKSKKSSKKNKNIPNPFDIKKGSVKPWPLEASTSNSSSDKSLYFPLLNCIPNSHLPRTDHTFSQKYNHDPIIEFPTSPRKVEVPELPEIEDLFKENVNEPNEEFIVIDIGTQAFKQTMSDQSEKNNVPAQSGDLSRALVSLSDASCPLPKQINPERLRTEHQVYELPHNHPLLKNFERPDSQEGYMPYLLAIWTEGQDEKIGDTSEDRSDHGRKTYSLEEVPDKTLRVLGTLLIPVRTAMRGSFPLNGTYFQINEVFADDETSQCPVKVPTNWIWMLKKRTLYCGSGTSAIFKGLSVEEIRRCCWAGYICTRGFNRQTRAPKPLPLRFHNRPQVKGKLQQDEEEEED